jgi:hypothetical protein
MSPSLKVDAESRPSNWSHVSQIPLVSRQTLLILAHPEAEAFVAEAKAEPSRKAAQSWKRFIKSHELLARYNVTDRELRAPEHLSLLGTVHSAKEFLAILTLIRDIPSIK